MWKQGACLVAIAAVVCACASGDGGGRAWYKQKSPATAGAAGMGHESAGQSGDRATERPDDRVGSAGSEAGED
jgi:hypothetical protein